MRYKWDDEPRDHINNCRRINKNRRVKSINNIERERKQVNDEQLAQLAIDEMRTGYPKFLVAYLKRVRKRADIGELTPHHIRIINNALMGYKPSNDAAALTNDDAMEIANMGE